MHYTLIFAAYFVGHALDKSRKPATARDAVKDAQREPGMQDGADPYGQFNKEQFIELGQELLSRIRPYVEEIKKYGRSPMAPMSDAPNRMQYKQFMDMCFTDADGYRKEALKRLGSSGNPLAQQVFNGQREGRGNPGEIEDMYLDLESLVNQLSGKLRGRWALE